MNKKQDARNSDEVSGVRIHRYRCIKDRFSPQTASVLEEITGSSNNLGVIQYYGGCYAFAVSSEDRTIPVGARVKVLGRIPGRNIWIVTDKL